VVVIEQGGVGADLVVDRLLGAAQTVIKPLLKNVLRREPEHVSSTTHYQQVRSAS